jgi:TolA-binding protein
MDRSVTPDVQRGVSALGRHVARLQEERVGADTTDAARSSFLRALDAREARAALPRPSRRPLAIGLGALVAAAAALVLWLHSANAMSFKVRDEPGHVGEWLVTTDELPIRFSDGTSLVLDGDSVGKVAAVSPTGAEIVVPQGSVHASVVHTTTSRWTVDVGPFVVHVTGTKFDASWDARERLFTLHLREGSVFVTGCVIQPQQVSAGSTISLRCEGARGDIEAPQADAGPSAVDHPLEPADAGAVLPETHDEASDAASTAVASGVVPHGIVDAGDNPSRPSWRALAAQGRSREALAAAVGGFDDECRHASAADVMLLADQARYAGDAGRARSALLAVRSRFPGSPQAGTAAFLLGRLSFDQRSFDDAATWFERASAESPGGPLAREVAGRLIEARQSAGQTLAARAAAQRYLQRYPSGPHASLAIRVLSSE